GGRGSVRAPPPAVVLAENLRLRLGQRILEQIRSIPVSLVEAWAAQALVAVRQHQALAGGLLEASQIQRSCQAFSLLQRLGEDALSLPLHSSGLLLGGHLGSLRLLLRLRLLRLLRPPIGRAHV